MKIIRNAVLFILAALMLLGAAACDSSSSEQPSDPKEVVKEGIIELYKDSYGDTIEKIDFTDIRIYSKEETAADELFADYKLGENDIVFEATYDIKVTDDFEDIIMLTAATGEIDGQWVRNKYNCGIMRYSDGKYSVDAFGTGF